MLYNVFVLSHDYSRQIRGSPKVNPQELQQQDFNGPDVAQSTVSSN